MPITCTKAEAVVCCAGWLSVEFGYLMSVTKRLSSDLSTSMS